MHFLGEHVANLYEMFNPIQDGELEPTLPLKKSNISGQILIKLRL